MKKDSISVFSKGILVLVSLLLLLTIFFPIWRIELSAPQYPEGLVLQLYAHKIAGDVDIINGLNHYIGMKTLHTDNFIEFTVLPYIIACLAICSLLVCFIKRKKGVIILFGAFLLFGTLSAIDFYKWNYDYGHNLDPNAAIKVPGMAYQPPLLGYKQLLNFGAYSIPDTGGWLLIVSGILLFALFLIETGAVNKLKRTKTINGILPLLLLFLASCSNGKEVPIALNADQCDFCRMTISDGKFGAELITQKGRAYKFDDIACMRNYCKENHTTAVKAYYVHDYDKENVLIPAETAVYLKGGAITSPMHGNTAAFTTAEQAEKANDGLAAETINWDSILKE
ncbi:nitrous oxide reductase accessory protein NosL [Flavobacterium sp. UBA4197]|uniref:nitrous oxide reductase accessory protein NosL n=1 Tax=Flavobacterium sp. UBA4197 TaxID=1946546 RepID=UPI002579F5CA|nr:nitrous oxide reductase accessory protein NosL [Flavobacterium sp. UBA4197]